MASTVVGARSAVEDVEAFVAALQAEARRRRLQVQAFDADMVFGVDHILSALHHADRAIEEGTNVASDRMVEVLVYASGERQISTALRKMGLKEGTNRMVILALGEGNVRDLLQALGLKWDDSLIEGRREMLPAFGITKEEMGTVPADRVFDLVLERVSLVDVLK